MTLHRVLRSLNKDDTLVIIGTQGVVLDVEGFARHAPCLTILNNLHDSSDIDHSLFDRYLKMPASEAAPAIEEIVMQRMTSAKRFNLFSAIRGTLGSLQ